MSRCTLAAPATQALEVRKSRFLAHAARIDAGVDALAWLREVADAAATHNCWAYRVGGDYRSSDDGEPAGTAGRPILAAIDQQGFDRVMVVVTRWYGGINLGAGGLARAYGGCAAECLRNAPRLPLVEMVEASMDCAFPLAGAVHALLPAYEAHKLAEEFDEHGLRLRLRLPASMFEGLAQRLRDLSRGAVDLHRLEARGE
jgi:uncharacterized YigZ family protein